MTFYEAAIEVLRRTGRPLHFKKITEVAIRDELLSHVGKAPEVTMSERLDQEIRKAAESWVIKTRPGVFTLRDDIAERLNEEAAARDAEDIDDEEEVDEDEVDEDEDEDEDEDVEDVDVDEEEDEDEEDEVAEQDEDDDDADEESDGEESAEADDEREDSGAGKDGGRRRRRRRRRGKGQREEETAQHAPTPESDRRKRRNRSGDKPEVSGRYDSVSEAAYAVLSAAKRSPMDIQTISETIFNKKLVKFHTHDRAATVQSAIVTDNQVLQRTGRRPLFAAYGPNLWGLTEWGLSDAGIGKEKEIQSLAQELREDACNQLGKLLVDLKAEALEMMVITLLERLDYRNLKISKRTSDGDVFLTADWRRGFSEMRVCVQVVGDAGAEIGAEDVRELRDTLSHYSGNEGILIHLGAVAKDAVKESRLEDEDMVTVIDRDALVGLLVQEGIGVRTHPVPVTMVDTAFVKALKG